MIDELDAGLQREIASLGLDVIVTDTVMRTPEIAAALAQRVLDAGRSRADVNQLRSPPTLRSRETMPSSSFRFGDFPRLHRALISRR